MKKIIIIALLLVLVIAVWKNRQSKTSINTATKPDGSVNKQPEVESTENESPKTSYDLPELAIWNEETLANPSDTSVEMSVLHILPHDVNITDLKLYPGQVLFDPPKGIILNLFALTHFSGMSEQEALNRITVLIQKVEQLVHEESQGNDRAYTIEELLFSGYTTMEWWWITNYFDTTYGDLLFNWLRYSFPHLEYRSPNVHFPGAYRDDRIAQRLKTYKYELADLIEKNYRAAFRDFNRR